MRYIVSTAILTAGLVLSGCATVEMIPGQTAGSEVTVDSADRLALRRSAKTLAYDFSRKGWAVQKDAASAQSAASVLLSGMKTKADGPSAQDIYITKAASVSAVKADIRAAEIQVRDLADMAVTVLAANPDAGALRKDLRAMETALLSARKAEMTFEGALKAKTGDKSDPAIEDLLSAIDALRTVTDAIGDRSRDSAVPAAAS